MILEPRPIDKAVLRKWLRDHKLTQHKLAHMLNVDNGTVERWARGVTKPPPYFSYVLDQLDKIEAEQQTSRLVSGRGSA